MLAFDAGEIQDLVSALEHDGALLQNLIQDDVFLDRLTELVSENFERVFGSKGSNIGEDWNGRTLVKTGNLKLSLTSPNRLNVQVAGNAVTFSSTVYYAGYVNDLYVFYGVDNEFDRALSRLVTNFLRDYGELEWR